MAKKITKKEMFTKLMAVDAVKADADMVAFIEKEIALLDKKNSAKKSLTKAQKENIVIKDAIVNALVADKAYTVSDVIATVDACADLSNQRVSALLTQLVADNKVARTVDKRKAYFSLV